MGSKMENAMERHQFLVPKHNQAETLRPPSRSSSTSKQQNHPKAAFLVHGSIKKEQKRHEGEGQRAAPTLQTPTSSEIINSFPISHFPCFACSPFILMPTYSFY